MREKKHRYLYILFLISSSFLFPMEHVKSGYPKWDGLVELQRAGLTTPRGIFVWPHSSPESIRDIVNYFESQSHTELIALRPEGINGIGTTPPGINLRKTDLEKILKQLIEWSTEGYGVTLVETHNRFDYDFCCNVLIGENGEYEIEFVGPGYDGGDLNKSILTATMVVKGKQEFSIFDYYDPETESPDWQALSTLYLKIIITGRVPTEEESKIRLQYIMTRLLPDMGIHIEKTLKATRDWLIQNNSARFLERVNPRTCISLEDLQKIVYSASAYAHYLRSNGIKLGAKALTAHKYEGKIVFFGTYDSQKWGTFPPSIH